jgi:hypothetical protein
LELSDLLDPIEFGGDFQHQLDLFSDLSTMGELCTLPLRAVVVRSRLDFLFDPGQLSIHRLADPGELVHGVKFPLNQPAGVSHAHMLRNSGLEGLETLGNGRG